MHSGIIYLEKCLFFNEVSSVLGIFAQLVGWEILTTELGFPYLIEIRSLNLYLQANC